MGTPAFAAEGVGLVTELPPASEENDLGGTVEGADTVRPDDAAVAALAEFFDRDRERVFFSRQVEVIHENQWFHWITNRALRTLIADGHLVSEERVLSTGGSIHLMWHRSYRYPRREAARVESLVAEYANPNIGAGLGLQGEMLTLEGFARHQFVLHGREVRAFGDREWTESAHDLDFVFERDGQVYGVEVKNKLGYMDQKELRVKVRLCEHLGIRPVFVARMLPKSWIYEVKNAGGFVLVLRWQLYPWTHRDLARAVHEQLGLPVDSPRALQDGTMQRFLRWHEKNV